MRIVTLVLAFATVLLAGPAVAGDSALRQLASGDDSRPFRAVGRLEMEASSFCTATLIEPRLVLTAAHCVVHEDGSRIAPGAIRFNAGLRDGHAAAYRSARRIAVAAGYRPGQTAPADLAHDVALIELDLPVDGAHADPIPTVSVSPARVAVVSYAHDRADRPALQEECAVLDAQRGALVMSCDVDYGSSGAPVLSIEAGRLEVVSVISAMAHSGGRKVALGTDLAATLPALRAEIARNDGVFHRAGTEIRHLTPEAARAAGPGKFLRP